MPQLRQNIVTGEWVVIAPERAKRPSDFVSAQSPKPQLKADCPFCVDRPLYREHRLKNFETNAVFVIPNSFPAFLEDPRHCSHRSYPLEDGFYNARPATGGHDVLIMKDHDQQLFDFEAETLGDLFMVAQKRYLYWRQDCNTNYAMLIYNQGPGAGASIVHPHAQIFASNIIPNQVSRELTGSQNYWEEKGSCVFCDLLAHEQKQKVRVIEETERFVAFTFYAARFPFETWLVPKQHQACFERETEPVLKELAQILQLVLAKIGTVLQKPALNFYLHDLPTAMGQSSQYYHWHLEITPRVSTYGGYELGSGTIIDVMSPEVAAGYLQKG